ncbi:uncharacterized protein M421DRAFT_279308 [Didymella exigua CBS 183.55]|uniref:Uncharacterized protein n=1 Tax=Didymella exigua CBS 183.55 TaxID=1150837 RepID=A0A6A5RA97_9PLEO|nr:uncharacterized protein M421DRAFT_279308 [Didymella exigua CBS 183.55]KAF1924463.1 hypothetical protein M421DRAFT_279308 [Didymella exigua CBS 183.55]
MTLYTKDALIALQQAQNDTNVAREAIKSAKRNAEELDLKLQKLRQEHDDCETELMAARACAYLEHRTYTC